MDNKKITTISGTIILLIIAVTVGLYIWQYEKSQSEIIQSVAITTKNQTPNQSNVVIINPSVKNVIETTNAPSNWKVYENQKYGFSIGYPKNWTVYDANTDSQSDGLKNDSYRDDFIEFTSKDKCIFENGPACGDYQSYYVYIFDKSKVSQYQEFKDRYSWANSANADDTYNYKLVDGDDVVLYAFTKAHTDSDAILPTAFAYTESKQYGYEFSITTEKGDQFGSVDYLEEALKYFKFN